jgi:uncharacterized protein
MAKQKNKKNKAFFYLLAILIIIVILDVALYVYAPEKKAIPAINNNNNNHQDAKKYYTEFIETENYTSIEMLLPAIDNSGNGTIAKLKVEAERGKGRTLIDVDNLLFFADTQHSIRVARLVAQDVTGKNMSDYNLIYSLNANASVIGGPSAGAALAIATIAAVQGVKPKNTVMITGAINRDGTIGPVSDILQKAVASEEVGAKILLVPLLQSRDVVYETKQSCEKFGDTELCTSETRPKRVNITDETGIKIVEIENIKEAMNYFF